MSTINTILSEHDVVEFADIDRHVAKCTIKDVAQVERFEFLKCLGIDFYNALLADKVDVSGVVSWVAGSYSTGNLVEYGGDIYKSTTDANTTEPSNGDWVAADKFTTPIYNVLLCDAGLGRYLAQCVARNNAMTQAVQFKDAGIVRLRGDSYDPASLAEVQAFIVSLNSSIDQLWQYLDYYLINNNDGSEFDLYKGNNTTLCEDCGSATCQGSCGDAKRLKDKYIFV